jgi:CRP-like cAMP-binding protein
MNQLKKYFDDFYVIPKDSFEKIEKITMQINLKKKDELQAIGKTCKTIYFLTKGLARIYYLKDGNDITDNLILENNMIVRVESLFRNQPSRKAIEVLEDSEIIAIDAQKLMNLYDENPQIERLFRKIFEASHVETINRIESLQFHTADERYKELIENHPQVIKRVSLKYIASYLGITQVSLSRIRAIQN